MEKITAITIAHNEAANIGRCIKSLLGTADEIIVLIDKKTTDATEAIVASFPEVSYQVVEWQGFSKTKQIALDMAKNDWIFWIDGDEELTVELADEIRALKSKLGTEVHAYEMPRRAEFLGRWIYHSGWYPGYVTRIFNKSIVKLSTNAVHEHLIVPGEKGRLQHDLNHYTDPSIKHYFKKFNSYTSLAAEDMDRANKSFSTSDILLRPLFLFVKMYIFKRGFLDGIQGFYLAMFSAHYVLVKYAKLWELRKNKGTI